MRFAGIGIANGEQDNLAKNRSISTSPVVPWIIGHLPAPLLEMSLER